MTTDGAANLGVSVVASESETSGPAICVHWMVGGPALMS